MADTPQKTLMRVFARCDIIKLNRVSTNALRLWLFPFPLTNKANDWLQNEEPKSFTTWEMLCKAFLSKYFPPGKTAKLRTEMTSLIQQDGESLYEAWERFEDLQR